MYSLPSTSQTRLPLPLAKEMFGSALRFKETTPPGIHCSFLCKIAWALGHWVITIVLCSFDSNESILGILGENQPSKKIFLRRGMAVQLESNRRGKQILALLEKVDDEMTVVHHPNSISDNEQLNSIPITDLFRGMLPHDALRLSRRVNAIAPVGIPDSPITAKH